MSRILGPQRRPWQLPLPEPVWRLMSSWVQMPASSAFQNTRFLMPLQMQTTFMPSITERVSGCPSAEVAGGAASGNASSDSSWRVGASIHAGMSKPILDGSRPSNPRPCEREVCELPLPFEDNDLAGRFGFMSHPSRCRAIDACLNPLIFNCIETSREGQFMCPAIEGAFRRYRYPSVQIDRAKQTE